MDKKREKILLVEDELFIRELYERVLRQAGFEVLTASDGEEGLAQAQSKPNLILLDIMMPKLNGIEVLEKLKSDVQTKDVPVVLLTNLGQENIIQKALTIGAKGYLMKMKLTPYDLVAKVQDFLNNPDAVWDLKELNFD